MPDIEMEFENVIFTPHFREDRYLHHACSGCEYEVRIAHEMFNKLDFGENFKFCPNCGKPVARFAQLPVFEEPPVEPALFSPLQEIFEEAEDRIEYYLYIKLTDNERKTLYDKAMFAEHLQEAGGPQMPNGAKIVLKYGYSKLTHWDKKRLTERMKSHET